MDFKIPVILSSASKYSFRSPVLPEVWVISCSARFRAKIDSSTIIFSKAIRTPSKRHL